jgi:sirohydrochlorin ferrochelatase
MVIKMKGVLILAHGSREKQTQDTFNTIVEMAIKEVDVMVETAYMEFSEKNIEAGLSALVAKGATEIKVVPYFLFSGMHIRRDIPKEIDEFLKNHSGITVKMGQTLGADPRLADVLADRIME